MTKKTKRPFDSDRAINELVGARVRAARRARNITQAQLSAASGVTIPAISELESGRRTLRLPAFLRIARGLDASPSYLLGATKRLTRFRS